MINSNQKKIINYLIENGASKLSKICAGTGVIYIDSVIKSLKKKGLINNICYGTYEIKKLPEGADL